MKRSEAIALINKVIEEKYSNYGGEILFQLEKAGMFPPHFDDPLVRDAYGRYETNFAWEQE